MNQLENKRKRLAVVEYELASLRARYELAISAFKFDEANAVQHEISALEGEQRGLAAAMPAQAAAQEPLVGVVPAIRQTRRRRTRRRS